MADTAQAAMPVPPRQAPAAAVTRDGFYFWTRRHESIACDQLKEAVTGPSWWCCGLLLEDAWHRARRGHDGQEAF